MTQGRPPTVRPLPLWMILLGSGFAGLHLLIIAAHSLAERSGPWPLPTGAVAYADPPRFAWEISELARPHYLAYLKMTHNYHFRTNLVAQPGVYLEARLKDENGKVVRTLRIPEEGVNPWVRHRQELLAFALAGDEPYQNRAGEAIAAPGRQAATVTYWAPGDKGMLKLVTQPEHLVPRDPPVMRPNQWSMLMARSYQRYLCREHDVAAVELIRHSKDPVYPMYLLFPPPPNAFNELICTFGDQRREN